MTGDLAVWFRGVLDADEQVARAATPGPWVLDGLMVDGPSVDGPAIGHFRWQPDTEHIARFDPAFVLADIAAKKAIVELHQCAPGPIALAGNINPGGWRASEIPHCDADFSPYPCETLRLLARPYRGRDGWREEWET